MIRKVPLLPGVTAQRINTHRISSRVLFTGSDKGTAVLFLHGNITSATWWEETMLALPDGFFGIAPDQRGFGEADAIKKIDATRGTGDLADDAVALLDHLGIEQAHLVGNSMGGSTVWRLLMDYPQRFLTVTQVAPGSPYGFGGTKDAEGTLCWPDFAGSGGGMSNPELIRRIQVGDRTMDNQFSPRAALRALVYKPPFVPTREEDLLMSTLQTHIGPQDQPGDLLKSAHWPYVAPGRWGMVNSVSPKYAVDIQQLLSIEHKPDILWIRGSHDLAISDSAVSCAGFLGSSGLLPDWPGMEIFPPQPMLAQTRAVLDLYAKAGGSYREVVIDQTAHVPFIEKPDEFNSVFHSQLITQPLKN